MGIGHSLQSCKEEHHFFRLNLAWIQDIYLFSLLWFKPFMSIAVWLLFGQCGWTHCNTYGSCLNKSVDLVLGKFGQTYVTCKNLIALVLSAPQCFYQALRKAIGFHTITFQTLFGVGIANDIRICAFRSW